MKFDIRSLQSIKKQIGLMLHETLEAESLKMLWHSSSDISVCF